LEAAGHIGSEHTRRVDVPAGLQPTRQTWVHLVEVLRGGAGLLRQVQATAELHDAAIQIIQECTQARADRKVHAHVPALHRVAQWRAVALTEELENIQRGVVAGRLDIADDLLEGLHGLRRDDELVLQEALRTVAAVPLTDDVQRLVELREVLYLVPRRR